MYKKAIEILPQHGLIQYEVSAFCRNKQLSIHNTGYWTGREFLGFGPSAFSYFEGKRFRNIANLPRYAALIQQKTTAIDFTDDVDQASRKREFLALHLRLLAGVCLTAFTQQFGPLDEETHTSLATLVSKGLLQQDNDQISLTHFGLLFYDTVASELI
jgi:oxygen-independent coproporphyrinogen-3 oxidase